ncbi:hypothetical protein COO91_09044 [Nostoc flagelliforme CCNUN1]|uniref:Uncharacterized protein n=1 Tax=Nostoc flagelliforme CCNUN1 TaxID=2038116 RepID=A0A2K8T751_9NOSO|nr:hypothetical protein [Nostoc flagelliforme]AUB42895.1 hypothetical protein COO91_09044 [Nostoc flagelliforme CCNUN1]
MLAITITSDNCVRLDQSGKVIVKAATFGFDFQVIKVRSHDYL